MPDQKEKKKTFLQKYWKIIIGLGLFIVAIVLIIMVIYKNKNKQLYKGGSCGCGEMFPPYPMQISGGGVGAKRTKIKLRVKPKMKGGSCGCSDMSPPMPMPM